MLARELYDEVEWYFRHERELTDAPSSLLCLIDGKEVTAPKLWLLIIEQVYDLHRNLLTPAMKARYRGANSKMVYELAGVSKQTFFAWRAEFLTDAILLAVKHNLIIL